MSDAKYKMFNFFSTKKKTRKKRSETKKETLNLHTRNVSSSCMDQIYAKFIELAIRKRHVEIMISNNTK